MAKIWQRVVDAEHRRKKRTPTATLVSPTAGTTTESAATCGGVGLSGSPLAASPTWASGGRERVGTTRARVLN